MACFFSSPARAWFTVQARFSSSQRNLTFLSSLAICCSSECSSSSRRTCSCTPRLSLSMFTGDAGGGGGLQWKEGRCCRPYGVTARCARRECPIPVETGQGITLPSRLLTASCSRLRHQKSCADALVRTWTGRSSFITMFVCLFFEFRLEKQ